MNSPNELSTCSSSRRYKEHLAPFSAGLELIQRLRPVTFNWKADGQRDLGLVAEEVAAIEPLLATRNAQGEIEGVKYVQLNVVLINAVKELKAENDTLTNTVKPQQQQLNTQRQELELMKKLLCAERPQAEFCQAPKQ